MRVREIGLIMHGIPVVSVLYEEFNKTSKYHYGVSHRSAIFTGILGFAEEIIAPINYIESNRFLFAFHKDYIRSSRSMEDSKEPLIAYLVMDKEKKKNEKIVEKSYSDTSKSVEEFYR